MSHERPRILPGKPSPLGATWTPDGVNFAVYSERAVSIDLCLFDQLGTKEVERIPLSHQIGFIWHCFVRDLEPGQLYGYRVQGPHQPEAGHRFNPAKLLIDPYARALAGVVDWQAPVFGYRQGASDADLSLDTSDDAAGVPKGVIIDPAFDWGDDKPPETPWSRTVIYEVHVKGFTVTHPRVPDEVRGTYSGLTSDAALDHLKSLGVTAVELLPVHAHIDGDHLVNKDLTNYWGYDTINFFAPHASYSSTGDRGGQVTEFKQMVKRLHENGIEVILDVVYNHTPEGNQLGPTLSFKGLDNSGYYRLVAENPRYYMDFTGTGNTLNVRNAQVLQLIMDSLRYWIEEMHVDGFRFDLASALARELYDVDRLSSFFDVIHQDPVISQVKLIAEPWDVGQGGYQVGNFPVLWAEWNGRYRDTVRGFWKGDERLTSEMAYRLTGSSDLYEDGGRQPYASINFVIAHDGFTLKDLVSYNDKHNQANGENNNDGTNDNDSWNCGVEGETEDDAILELRDQQMRNFFATIMFSQGVPMICGGDEIARTQDGNNNAYCQDNEISWYNWDLDWRARRLLDFTSDLIAVRRQHPALRRRNFFRGRAIRGDDVKDVTWLRPDGAEMSDQEWNTAWVKCFGMQLSGELGEIDNDGTPIDDDDLMVLLNADTEPHVFSLPSKPEAPWDAIIDTSFDRPAELPANNYEVKGRSIVLLKRPR